LPAGATLASGEVFRVLPLKSCDRDEDRNGHMENPPWRKVLSLLSSIGAEDCFIEVD